MHEPGKIDLEFFERVIAPRLGARRDDVIVPPKNGVDCGIVQVGDRVMALTTDPPFYIVPQYGWDKAAWFAFHIIASDLCTSGLKPDFMTIDLNLPLDIEDEAIEKIMETVSREAKKLDCAIVTGHTARYSGGVNYPMVGGATMIGVGEKDRFVTPEMARPGGDRVIMTKTAALEAAVILSHTFPEYIGANLSEYDVKMLQKLFFKMSTVIESMEASKFGLREHGVTAMHDATEGGVLGALFELAEASGVGLDIEGGTQYLSTRR
ncbi:AIR synthase [Thermogymnomonas acidicola]|uniref:AIR synthase related protein n=1 Tax=Thermogymnomonas acidicola TaxID=399579 RepID=UPI000A84D88E|nr:AIR synthase related protein [Thermogymnomonas acidicola]